MCCRKLSLPIENNFNVTENAIGSRVKKKYFYLKIFRKNQILGMNNGAKYLN